MNKILGGLFKAANKLVERIKDKIRELRAPRDIADGIEIGSPQMDGATRAYIDVIIKHPAAKAWAWGSGIHSTRGPKEKYPIPKEPTGVAIPISRWPNYRPPPDVDVAIFSQIQHPGVEPRDFISPSLDDVTEEVKKILAESAKEQLMEGITPYKEIVIG